MRTRFWKAAFALPATPTPTLPNSLQVINAGCAPKDLKYFEEKLGKFSGDVKMTVQWDNRGLYALQGPQVSRLNSPTPISHRPWHTKSGFAHRT